MQEEEDQLKNLSRWYTRLAVASLFLMALLQGLHSFFFSLFFWPAVGFGVLAFYYRIAANRQAQASTAQWQQPDSAASGFKGKGLTLVVIVAAVSLLVIISSVVSSLKDNNTTTQETVQPEDDTDSLKAEKKSSPYDRAILEYNKQNYRQSIAIARQGEHGDANNNDLMLVLGDSYGGMKQYDSAFFWYNKAYQNGARGANLSHWLGYLYDEKGSQSQALEFYKDALKQDSALTQIYNRLAELEPEKASWYKKKSSQWANSK